MDGDGDRGIDFEFIFVMLINYSYPLERWFPTWGPPYVHELLHPSALAIDPAD